MNKKNIILILIFTIFISVMIMSTVGKNPDESSSIPATELVFYNENNDVIENIEEGLDQAKLIELEETEETIEYVFTVEILPIDTTQTNLSFDVVVGDCTITEIEQEGQGSKFIDEGKPSERTETVKYKYKAVFTVDQQTPCKIKFTFNGGKGGAKKQDYLKFIFKPKQHDQDIDL